MPQRIIIREETGILSDNYGIATGMSHSYTFSSCNNCRFFSMLPAYPISEPFFPITR